MVTGKHTFQFGVGVLILLSSLCCVSVAEDPWKFLVVADWSGGEPYATNPGNNSETYQKDVQMVSYIHQTYGGELIFAPGDYHGGKWYRQSFIDEFFPEKNTTPQEAVYATAMNVYTTMKMMLLEGGYDKFLFAIGDHELGGDGKGWFDEKLDNKTASLPQYREAFVKVFNRYPQTDEFIYTKYIGNATASPIGTEFEYTSYAYQHKNVLLITVDVFTKFDHEVFSRKEGIGGKGVVTFTVTGDHLNWFENVLQEAEKDPTIRHIFVQSHMPILHPVRKIHSSGLYIDYGEDSDFWKAMIRYNVDIYFAGEVHDNTVIQDRNSNLLQVTTRGNLFNNLMTVDITDNTILLRSFDEVGDLPRGCNHNHTINGSVEIVKDASGPDSVSITSTGVLELLDRKKPLIHFGFEEIIPLYQRPVLGMEHDNYETTLKQTNMTIRDIVCSDSVPNRGSFSQQYDGQVANIPLVDGKVGQYAGRFLPSSRFGVYGYGPLAAGHITSSAIWFKTEASSKEMIMMHYAGVWGLAGRDVFMLTLHYGSPKLYLKVGKKSTKNSALILRNAMDLADGEWHHIAIVMPQKSCRMSKILFYVNGVLVETETINNRDNHVYFVPAGSINLGGYGYTSLRYDDVLPDVEPFTGFMDDFYLWDRSLTADEILSIVGDTSCEEDPKKKFIRRLVKTKNGVVKKVKLMSCGELAKKSARKIANICSMRQVWHEGIGPAFKACLCTCSSS